MWILPVSVLAVLTGAGFGFAIAGVADSPEVANRLNLALFAPVVLLAGVQYALQGLPGVLPQLTEFVGCRSPPPCRRSSTERHAG
ncbi:MAG: hypothetical protein ACRDL5_17770 [Solirubrobacteraceae bacterium]